MSSPDPNAEHDAHGSDRAQDLDGESPAVKRERSTYMTEYEAEQFCQTFADGLDSGIGYARILDVLERQSFDSTIITRMRDSLLESGDMLADALTRQGLLDPSARKLVRVAEQQGSLPDTFDQLARIYRKRYKRKKRVAYSFVEPIIMVGLGIALINLLDRNIVTMAFAESVWPHIFAWAFDSALKLGLYGIAIVSTIVAWLNLPVDLSIREAALSVWMRLPLVSRPSRKFSVSLFCRYLKESLANGMTVYDGLELAGEACQNPHILSAVVLAKERIEDGASLVNALRAMPHIPDKVIDQVDIGEESGRLEERLLAMADDFEEQADESFDRLIKVFIWIVRYTIVVLVIGTVFKTVMDLGLRAS